MKWLVAALALVAGIVLGAAGWLLYTDSGLRWAAGFAQDALQGKLKLEGLRGALGRDIEAASIQYQDEKTRVELREAHVRLELLSFLGARAGIRELRAKSLEVTLAPGPSDGKPPAAPRIALGLRVDRADIERITLALGAERWDVEGFTLRDAGLLPTGSVSASAAFTLRHDQYPVTARIGLGGTIERLEVAFDGRRLTLDGSALADDAPPLPTPLLPIGDSFPGWQQVARSAPPRLEEWRQPTRSPTALELLQGHAVPLPSPKHR